MRTADPPFESDGASTADVDLSPRFLAGAGLVAFVAIAATVATLDLTQANFRTILVGAIGGYLLGFVGMVVTAVEVRQ